ncbi:hypothetical protein ACFE04_015921 [Oxalis oulophora]
MAYFSCFHILIGKKKKDRGNKLQVNQYQKGLMNLRLEQPVKPVEIEELKLTTLSDEKQTEIGKHHESVNVMGHDNTTGQEIAYEGEDEHEDNNSVMKRELSDFDLQAYGENSSDQRSGILDYSFSFETEPLDQSQSVHVTESDFVQSGHVSDPGVGKAELWGSPKLKRTCSNLETRSVLRKVAGQLPNSKSQSFGDLSVSEGVRPHSPVSLASRCSADKVMLKKHSSSQILPSKSRRLWWKLFLWSHRNLHKANMVKPHMITIQEAHGNQQGGYCSDTLEQNQTRKMESPGSYTGESFKIESPSSCNEGSPKKGADIGKQSSQNWNGFSGLWPQNQWVAFPAESTSFARVNEWVRDLENQPLPPIYDDNDDAGNGDTISPKSPERITSHGTRHPDGHLTEEVMHANSVIQSLNSSSTVAHISGIGLKAVPMISCFSSLRAVNLSNNFIVHISAGSLPKGLHALNLSRNKISTIEGLRELTRLRVLDLSYNRISRIGQALNILGNPIQSNISEDQLRKAVCGLLPKLTYLNKQAIKPQRAREVITDNVARAALGNSSRDLRRKALRRVVSHGVSTSSSNHRGSPSRVHKSRDRSQSRTRHNLSLKSLSANHASSSRQW